MAVCTHGALAQLGERLICIQEVIGSIPIGSTKSRGFACSFRRSPAQFGAAGATGLLERQGCVTGRRAASALRLYRQAQAVCLPVQPDALTSFREKHISFMSTAPCAGLCAGQPARHVTIQVKYTDQMSGLHARAGNVHAFDRKPGWQSLRATASFVAYRRAHVAKR